MDNLTYILFACIAFPLLLSTFLMEKRAALVVGFVIIGCFMALFASEVNTLLQNLVHSDLFYVTTNVTTISEEVLKGLPVLLYAFVFSDNRERLITLGAAVGIGFAIFENTFIFVNNGSAYELAWALQRAVGASLMHAICTGCIGFGISFVRKKRKLFLTGTFALLITSTVYHSIFNTLVQSKAALVGFVLTIVTYIPIVVVLFRRRKARKE